MRRFGLVGLAFAFLLAIGLGCSDSEPKKEETNPFKARDDASKGLKEKGKGKGIMSEP